MTISLPEPLHIAVSSANTQIDRARSWMKVMVAFLLLVQWTITVVHVLTVGLASLIHQAIEACITASHQAAGSAAPKAPKGTSGEPKTSTPRTRLTKGTARDPKSETVEPEMGTAEPKAEVSA